MKPVSERKDLKDENPERRKNGRSLRAIGRRDVAGKRDPGMAEEGWTG